MNRGRASGVVTSASQGGGRERTKRSELKCTSLVGAIRRPGLSLTQRESEPLKSEQDLCWHSILF